MTEIDIQKLTQQKISKLDNCRYAACCLFFAIGVGVTGFLWSVFNGHIIVAGGILIGIAVASIGCRKLFQIRDDITKSMCADWSALFKGVEVVLPSGERAKVVAVNEVGTRFQVTYEDGYRALFDGAFLKTTDQQTLSSWSRSSSSQDDVLLKNVFPVRWRLLDGRIGIIRGARRENLRDGGIDDYFLLKVGDDAVREYRRIDLSAYHEGAAYPPFITVTSEV